MARCAGGPAGPGGGAPLPAAGGAPLGGTERRPAAATPRAPGRLAVWFDGYRRRGLGPLLRAAAGLVGAPRGLVFQLCAGLGSVPRGSAREQVEALTQDERRALRRLGVHIGRHSVFFPALLKPAANALRAVLWCVGHAPETPPLVPRIVSRES